MLQCACLFKGDLGSKEHRDFHRVWEASRPEPGAADEILELLVRLDDQEARLAECERRLGVEPLPLSRGAQAIVARSKLKGGRS